MQDSIDDLTNEAKKQAASILNESLYRNETETKAIKIEITSIGAINTAPVTIDSQTFNFNK